jgi:hypothetical protein
MYGMKRTTVYLPEDLKAKLEHAAELLGTSEAELIRRGISAAVEAVRPQPRLPLFSSGRPDLATNVDQLLDGFGEE